MKLHGILIVLIGSMLMGCSAPQKKATRLDLYNLYNDTTIKHEDGTVTYHSPKGLSVTRNPEGDYEYGYWRIGVNRICYTYKASNRFWGISRSNPTNKYNRFLFCDTTASLYSEDDMAVEKKLLTQGDAENLTPVLDRAIKEYEKRHLELKEQFELARKAQAEDKDSEHSVLQSLDKLVAPALGIYAMSFIEDVGDLYGAEFFRPASHNTLAAVSKDKKAEVSADQKATQDGDTAENETCSYTHRRTTLEGVQIYECSKGYSTSIRVIDGKWVVAYCTFMCDDYKTKRAILDSTCDCYKRYLMGLRGPRLSDGLQEGD